MENGYRLGIGAIVAILFGIQRAVVLRTEGDVRTIAGYVVTMVLLIAVAEFATMALWNRIAGRPALSDTRRDWVSIRSVIVLASLLLALDAYARLLSPYLAVQRRPAPTVPLLIVVSVWVGAVLLAWRRWSPYYCCLIGLAGLVLGTRVLVLWVCRYDQMTGDMLPTIDRSLDELFAGRFPYVNFPPPMPYLPGMFFAYAPAKSLGFDLRVTNLVLDVITVVAVMFLAPGARGRASDPAAKESIKIDQVALPLFMLHPTWVYFSVNTQFSPCFLTMAMLGLAVVSAGPRWQAVTLGLAVGSSQMLAATGPILFAYWLSRHGWRKSVGLAALSAGVFLTIIAPFLLWNPRQFLQVAFLSRGAFPPELMSGAFTLLPMVSGIIPHAGEWLTAIGVGLGAVYAMKARSRQSVVAAMAIGLCVALVAQPVTFPHYFLPVIILASIAAGQSAPTHAVMTPRALSFKRLAAGARGSRVGG